MFIRGSRKNILSGGSNSAFLYVTVNWPSHIKPCEHWCANVSKGWVAMGILLSYSYVCHFVLPMLLHSVGACCPVLCQHSPLYNIVNLHLTLKHFQQLLWGRLVPTDAGLYVLSATADALSKQYPILCAMSCNTCLQGHFCTVFHKYCHMISVLPDA